VDNSHLTDRFCMDWDRSNPNYKIVIYTCLIRRVWRWMIMTYFGNNMEVLILLFYLMIRCWSIRIKLLCVFKFNMKWKNERKVTCKEMNQVSSSSENFTFMLSEENLLLSIIFYFIIASFLQLVTQLFHYSFISLVVLGFC
jgi:hypothetical protein